MDLLSHEQLRKLKNHQTSLPVRNRKPIITWPEGQQTWHVSLKEPMIILKWIYKSNILISNQSWEKAFFEHCCYFGHSRVTKCLTTCLAITDWALCQLYGLKVFATRFGDTLCQQAYVCSYGQIVLNEANTKLGVSAHLQHWFWNDITCLMFVYV